MSRSMNFNGPTKSAPIWLGDFANREVLLPGGVKLDAAQFLALDAVLVTTTGAAAAAVSVPCAALSGPIPAGSLIDFGTTKLAITTAAVAAGAVAIPVRALPTALVNGDIGTYAGVDRKSVPNGTIVGRTYAERDANTPFGPAASTDDEMYIVASDVFDLNLVNDADVVTEGKHVVIKENFLPNFSTLAGALVTQLRARWRSINGVA